MRSYILELCPTGVGLEYYNDNKVRWNQNDAGVDLFVVEDVNVKRHQSALVSLGVSARLICKKSGKDVHFYLNPRSSIFKSGIIMANSVGVIDKGYRGELKGPVVAFIEEANIKAGTRLFQVVSPNMDPIMEVRIVESLPETERGSGGFGSTGLDVAKTSKSDPTASYPSQDGKSGTQEHLAFPQM